MMCWGLGAVAAGHKHPQLDMVECRRCGRRLRGKWHPAWFDQEGSARLWEEGSAECVDCLRARHVGCPCGHVERTGGLV